MTLNICASNIAVLVPRLRVGGADAYIRDALNSLADTPNAPNVLLYVIHSNGATPFQFDGVENIPIRQVLSVNQRLAFIKDHLLRRNVKIVLTQLVGLSFLQSLWMSGLRTVIIFQNEELTWSYSPSSLSRDNVPFLLTSCTRLARCLSAASPTIPLSVLRPMPDSPTGKSDRESLRRSWSVPHHALLIGMVGSFKLHKRYTHAIRILHILRSTGINAYLVIVGGHSEMYGGGEQAYRAAQCLAEKLGVQSFLRCPGEFADPGDLYQAFDLFLNTSLYEGLSRATFSASSQGCLVVATDVGGQAEAISCRDSIVQASSSAEEIADAILSCLRQSRLEPSISNDLTHAGTTWSSIWERLDALSQQGEPFLQDDKTMYQEIPANVASGNNGAFSSHKPEFCSKLPELRASYLRDSVPFQKPSVLDRDSCDLTANNNSDISFI